MQFGVFIRNELGACISHMHRDPKKPPFNILGYGISLPQLGGVVLIPIRISVIGDMSP